MKRQPKAETVYFQNNHGDDSVENSKRRHMMSVIEGNAKFFERILSIKRIQEPVFDSRSSGRGC